MDWRAHHTELEALVQQGQGIKAASQIRKLTLRKIPRRFASPFASIARQAGLPDVAIRILNPFIRPRETSTGGSAAERATYAAALIRIGAIGEALALLKSLGHKENPEVLLYTTHALVATWRYSESIPLMEEYLRQTTASVRQQVIGRLNLAAALIHEKRYENAEGELDFLRRETLGQNFLGFHGNALVLSAQSAIGMKDWPSGRRFLDEAEKFLSAKGGLELFFVEKWRALLSLYKERDRKAEALVAEVRKSALEHSHWETVRDCDLAIALEKADKQMLTHLYFGTPYNSFRKRIFTDFKQPISIPEVYDWCLPSAKSDKTLDLLSELESKVEVWGVTACRVLWALVSDFYRPVRIASLFSAAYPGQFFSPNSSAPRIHQSICQLRRLLKNAGVVIHSKGSNYRVSDATSCTIRVPKREPILDENLLLLRKLNSRFPAGFSAEDASNYLKVPRRTLGHFLKNAAEAKDVTKKGSGPATRYHIKAL